MLRRVLILVPCLAAGLAFAVLIVPNVARAWTPDQLPDLGYSVHVTRLPDGCRLWSATGFGKSADLGNDCDTDFQARLDSFVNATCPCAATTSSTTAAAPATAPATTAAGTTVAVTVTEPPATTVADIPPVTVTTTATATSPAPDPTIVALQARIADLEAKYDSLNTRVIALETKLGVTVYGVPDGYTPSGVTYAGNLI